MNVRIATRILEQRKAGNGRRDDKTIRGGETETEEIENDACDLPKAKAVQQGGAREPCGGFESAASSDRRQSLQHALLELCVTTCRIERRLA